MGICSCQSGSPLTDRQVLVDKLIGTPYEFVKYVAANMGLISYVANIFKGAAIGQPMLTKRTTTITGKVNGLGAAVSYDIPPEIDVTKIDSIVARVSGADGSLYYNDSRYFHVAVIAGKVNVLLRADASAGFIDAALRIVIVYGE